LGIEKGSVAAFKAHLSRGSYGAGRAAEYVEHRAETTRPTRRTSAAADAELIEAVRRNLHQLDPSLRAVAGERGRRLESGEVEILGEDATGLVVVEVVSGAATEAALTRLLSHVGALSAEEPHAVRGVLVAQEFPGRLRLVAQAARVDLFEYEYEIWLRAVQGTQNAASFRRSS
jgi:RecB family endonuclease NucS